MTFENPARRMLRPVPQQPMMRWRTTKELTFVSSTMMARRRCAEVMLSVVTGLSAPVPISLAQ
jgi:hypothetical protein